MGKQKPLEISDEDIEGTAAYYRAGDMRDDVLWRNHWPAPEPVTAPDGEHSKLIAGLPLLALMLWLMFTGHFWAGMAVLFVISWLGL